MEVNPWSSSRNKCAPALRREFKPHLGFCLIGGMLPGEGQSIGGHKFRHHSVHGFLILPAEMVFASKLRLQDGLIGQPCGQLSLDRKDS